MIFVVLEAPGKGAVGPRIIRNAKECNDLHGFGSGWEGAGWMQNHKKFMGLSSFSFVWKWLGDGEAWPQNHKKRKRLSTCSWFWKWAGGGRLASES